MLDSFLGGGGGLPGHLSTYWVDHFHKRLGFTSEIDQSFTLS